MAKPPSSIHYPVVFSTASNLTDTSCVPIQKNHGTTQSTRHTHHQPFPQGSCVSLLSQPVSTTGDEPLISKWFPFIFYGKQGDVLFTCAKSLGKSGFWQWVKKLSLAKFNALKALRGLSIQRSQNSSCFDGGCGWWPTSVWSLTACLLGQPAEECGVENSRKGWEWSFSHLPWLSG